MKKESIEGQISSLETKFAMLKIVNSDAVAQDAQQQKTVT